MERVRIQPVEQKYLSVGFISDRLLAAVANDDID